jgi:cytochrome P450
LETTIERLKSSPQLLNQLPFTHAVHKEVLRLFTIGMTIKKAVPGATVTYQGRTYPMENHMIAILASDMGRSENYWSNPHEFIPDRFLKPEDGGSSDQDAFVGEGYKPANVAAWQPFEKGPRNCIGQQLSLLEAKVISVLTVRWFDFEAKYAKDAPGIAAWGGKAYQVMRAGASPKDGIPMVVKMVEK